jgi:hypothetical protein
MEREQFPNVQYDGTYLKVMTNEDEIAPDFYKRESLTQMWCLM